MRRAAARSAQTAETTHTPFAPGHDEPAIRLDEGIMAPCRKRTRPVSKDGPGPETRAPGGP